MLYKKVKLNIFCSKAPFELTIMCCDSKVIKRKVIKTNCTTICVCTQECFIKLFAKYRNQIMCQKICLCDMSYQNIFVNFVLKKVFSKITNCTIILTDTVYGLPVKNAFLHFNKKLTL